MTQPVTVSGAPESSIETHAPTYRPNSSHVLIDLGIAVFAFYVGLSLWRIQPNALKLVKAYFIVGIVQACSLIASSIYLPVRVSKQPSGGPFETGIRILVLVAIWATYFRKSERVKATYGSNPWGHGKGFW